MGLALLFYDLEFIVVILNLLPVPSISCVLCVCVVYTSAQFPQCLFTLPSVLKSICSPHCFRVLFHLCLRVCVFLSVFTFWMLSVDFLCCVWSEAHLSFMALVCSWPAHSYTIITKCHGFSFVFLILKIVISEYVWNSSAASETIKQLNMKYFNLPWVRFCWRCGCCFA